MARKLIMIVTNPGLPVITGDKTTYTAYRSPYARLQSLIFTDDPLQRATISFLLMSVAVFMVLLYAVIYGIRFNLFEQAPLLTLASCWTISAAIFYVIIRSGLNQRFRDKTLSLAQTCVAQTLIVYAYASTGEIHAALLPVMSLIMVFGMFNMKPHATQLSCGFSIALLGAAILVKTGNDPYHYQPRLEWLYFVLATTSLVTIANLSIRLGNLRSRLKQKKSELERAYEHIQKMATHDELTGLSNRRQLKNLLEQHVERQARTGQEFYVAMIDIDHFKIINDSYGHQTGDEVLKNLSTGISELLRKTDIIGRWGGEEFLLLLPDTGNDLVSVAMSRLHETIIKMPMVMYPPLFISFSAGLTKYRAGEHIEQTIKRADELLYVAKSNGRNQIVHDEVEQLAA